ncbi:MAG TPA: hypothetical protein VMB23_07340 [Spirochaetia bacterium]|nr:hypothetical protein [Spirochaetia bacterium]
MALKPVGWFTTGVACGILAAGVAALGMGALGSADLDHRKAELARIATDLAAREAALTTSQARVTAQATEIRQRVSVAAALADQVVAGQGSVLERLKKVTTAVRQLRDDLRGIQTSE